MNNIRIPPHDVTEKTVRDLQADPGAGINPARVDRTDIVYAVLFVGRGALRECKDPDLVAFSLKTLFYIDHRGHHSVNQRLIQVRSDQYLQ